MVALTTGSESAKKTTVGKKKGVTTMATKKKDTTPVTGLMPVRKGVIQTTPPAPAPEKKTQTLQERLDAILAGTPSTQPEAAERLEAENAHMSEQAGEAASLVVSNATGISRAAGAIAAVSLAASAIKEGIIAHLGDMDLPTLVTAYKALGSGGLHNYVGQCGIVSRMFEIAYESAKATATAKGLPFNGKTGGESDADLIVGRMVDKMAAEAGLDLAPTTARHQRVIWDTFFADGAQPSPEIGTKEDLIGKAMVSLNPSLLKMAALKAGDPWHNLSVLVGLRAEDPTASVKKSDDYLNSQSSQPGNRSGDATPGKDTSFEHQFRVVSPHLRGLVCAIARADMAIKTNKAKHGVWIYQKEDFEWTFSVGKEAPPEALGLGLRVSVNAQKEIVVEAVAIS